MTLKLKLLATLVCIGSLLTLGPSRSLADSSGESMELKGTTARAVAVALNDFLAYSKKTGGLPAPLVEYLVRVSCIGSRCQISMTPPPRVRGGGAKYEVDSDKSVIIDRVLLK